MKINKSGWKRKFHAILTKKIILFDRLILSHFFHLFLLLFISLNNHRFMINRFMSRKRTRTFTINNCLEFVMHLFVFTVSSDQRKNDEAKKWRRHTNTYKTFGNAAHDCSTRFHTHIRVQKSISNFKWKMIWFTP